MDCDDVTLLLATGMAPTVLEAGELQRHAEGCDACRQLAAMTDDQYRWVVRIPEDAADDQDLPSLPIVDPVVFTTEEELARGGMGRITRARDRRLGREIAIKEVLDPSLRARFEREAMITASLQHPAIIPIYEAGTWPDGSSFYAMRLVSGGTLQEAIGKTKTLEERLALLPHVRALTEALAYAHSRRIVHRDLKPGNVLVGEFGETVVIDWGLAKDLDRDTPEEPTDGVHEPMSAELTRVGSVLGTPGFMSPEQAAGVEVDERADVYALGAILYNVLAGHAPFGDLDVDKITAARERTPTPVATLAPGLPADLRAIAERAMARRPEDRYPTAQQMAEELRRFEAGQLLRSREYGLRELVARWIRKHRATVIIGLIAFLIVAGVGIGAVIGIARSRAAEHAAREIAEQARATAEVAQGSAEQARKKADLDAITLLEEQGRDELIAGDRDRGLAYLSEAYARGRDTVALRHLLAVATRDLELADHVIDPHSVAAGPAGGEITSIGFAADGRAVTVDSSDAGTIAVWAGDKPVVSHPIGAAFGRSRLSADTRRAAIILNDERVAMYDTSTGVQLWTIRDPLFVGPTVVFDTAGKNFVVMSGWTGRENVAQLRDVETGALRATLVAGTDAKTDAAFSSDGKFVATSGMDGTVAAWEISSGKRIMMAHAKLGLTTIVFVGNERVVTGTGEREAWIWPLNGQPPIPLTGHHDAITAIAANPYGDLVAIGDATGGVRLWGLHGELIGEAHDARGAVEELVFSPDQSLLLGGGADKRAYIWEIDSLALRRAVTAYQGAPGDPHYRNADHGLVWNADGSQFASVGSGEHRASVWRTPTGARVVRFWSRATTLAGQFAVTADDTRLVVQRIDTGVENPAIELAPPFPRPLDTLPKLGATWLDVGRDFIQVSRDSRQAMIWGPEIATLYALPKWAPLGDVPTTKANIGRLVPALTPDGKFVLELDATAARLVTAGVGTAVHELAIPGAVDGAIGPDDEHLVLVFGAQPPRMWRMSTGTEIPLHVHGGARHARFDPSGSRVVVYGEGAANVIDADTGATLATLGGSVIDDARFDRDGHRLATWARDHAAKLWNLETSSALVAVEGVPWRAFAVTDDGARFATGSDDGAIAIWDSATSRLLQVLHGERGLAGLAWSADGTRLLAKALGDRATIWDVHLEQRSPAEIAKLAEQASAWRLVDGQLVPRARP